MVILPSDQAIASTFWEDLWSTRDQQGQALMQSGDPAAAAERFEDPLWRSTALYRSDDYPAAAESFSSLDSELAHYNRGNALARAGDLQGAIDAYETVLEFNQDHADAQFNKDLVNQLLEQQEQASQQSSEEDPSEDQNSNDNSENDSSQQNDQSSADEEESSPQSSQSEPEEGDNSQEEEEEASQASNNDADEAAPEEQASLEEAALTDEEAQALDQWLKRVPDDPGGLLRRKFEQQFETRVREGEITQQDFERNW
jgi:Ca-activated chloride channel family protein